MHPYCQPTFVPSLFYYGTVLCKPFSILSDIYRSSSFTSTPLAIRLGNVFFLLLTLCMREADVSAGSIYHCMREVAISAISSFTCL